MKRVINAQEKELCMYVAEDATYATGNQAIFKKYVISIKVDYT